MKDCSKKVRKTTDRQEIFMYNLQCETKQTTKEKKWPIEADK